MDDRELLELAAKAAGYAKFDWLAGDGVMNVYHADGLHEYWSPLADDGDALRLAVRLQMAVSTPLSYSATAKCADVRCRVTEEECGHDPFVATRRAIVRAAAAIGRQMKEKA